MSVRNTDLSANSKTVISVDVMSGESGIAAAIGGVASCAAANPDVHFLLHGDKAKIDRIAAKRSELLSRYDVQDTDVVIPMTQKPSLAARRGKGSSMWNAVQAVKDGKAAVAVSCGNTGALMAVSTLILRRAPNVNRPAIAIYWPSRNPAGYNIMLDVGADIRADADDLTKYAIMGAAYARHGLGLQEPRVGILNVGTEEHKGREALQEAAANLEGMTDADFQSVGFVEGGDIPSDRVDVIVTDGFTGNVALKTAEGTAIQIGELVRETLQSSILTKLGALLSIGPLKSLRQRIDPRTENGGVFLGLNGTVVKSHGAADATGVFAALQLSVRLAENKFHERLAARVASEGPSAQS
jgi:glycerol-3-phosphate acyltransferase PlsX